MSLAEWNDFYMMAGGAIAALTGLLFVAMSIHLSEIVAKPVLTRCIAMGLWALAYELVICGVLLVPAVPSLVVGLVVGGGGLTFAVLYARVPCAPGVNWNLVVAIAFVVVGALLALAWWPALYALAALLGLSAVAIIRLCWGLLTAAVIEEAARG